MKTTEKRSKYPEEFKQNALKLADKIGVQNTADKLNIPLSNLHRWKSQKNIPIEKSQDVLKLQAEVKRLKKQLAEEKAAQGNVKKSYSFFFKGIFSLLIKNTFYFSYTLP